MISSNDQPFLKRSVELAKIALLKGHAPFGSVLVSEDNQVLFEDHNRNGTGDETRHPEFEIARWAAEHLSPEERAKAVVYTSGEHCSMCSSAHALVGLGRIVYASSSGQLNEWKEEWGIKVGRLKTLAIEDVIKDCHVDGPDEELAKEVKQLQARYYEII